MRTPRRALALLAAVLFWSASAPSPAAAQTCSLVHSFARESGSPQSGLVLGDDGVLFGTARWGGAYGLGSIYTLTPDGVGGYTYATLYSFAGDQGTQPIGALVRGSDGMFYGTTSGGLPAETGTLFRIGAAGTLTTLHAFLTSEGKAPMAALVEAAGGVLYGTTSAGGAFVHGSVFRMDLSGSNFAVVHAFVDEEGGPGRAGVVLGGGFLYGTTYQSASYVSLIYQMDSAGVLTPLHAFTEAEGLQPDASLVFGPDGQLYGTARQGGQDGFGTLFRVDTAGEFDLLHSFALAEGAAPMAPLVISSDGMLYGAASSGGAVGMGTIFRITIGGGFEMLRDLGTTEGREPQGALLEDVPGVFYGTTADGGDASRGTVFRVDTNGAYEKVHDFAPTEGVEPRGGLSEDASGLLWGATAQGGAFGRGTAFSLDPSGPTLTTVHGFSAPEGSLPIGPPIPDPDGKLYGVTATEAAHGWGAFYRLDPAGPATVLHDFTDSEQYGSPYLIRADDGNYYGATLYHVLRLNTSGNVTSIHDFSGPFVPNARLVQGSDSALYGMMNGGAFGDGSAFRLALDGTFTTLHDFSLSIDGAGPFGGLAEADDGNFYGTVSQGGQFGNGFVFRVTPAGQFWIIHSFGAQGSGDAARGNNGVIQAADGYLYGASVQGGHSGNGDGALFRLDLQGTESVVHSFVEFTRDGIQPHSELLEASDGLLYGTTALGGQYGGGSIFRADPSTVIPVLAVSPTSGPAGDAVMLVSVTGLGFQVGAEVWMGINPMPVSTSTPTELKAFKPVLSPGTLVHVAVINPDGSEGSLGRAFFADFLDVPQANIFHAAIEKILRDGVTAGCGSGNYCATNAITRAQMAIFLLRAFYGAGYTPPPATGTVFADVPADGFAAAWIEDIAARGITAGCGVPNYCPSEPVTRAQMAVFLLKTLLGPGYAPPDPTGTVFGDVSVDAFAAAWIEDISGRGITGGCQASPPLFCPATPNTRQQMAAFLVNTFGLP